MEITYLKEFVVLAQTGNFMEVAEILNSSQSTLSKHIKAIELELGVPLFDRTTRKVSISKYGQLFLPYAQQIAELQEQYVAALQTSLATDHETLTLGSIYGLAQYSITDALVNFKKSRPHSTFNVLQASSKDLTDALRQKKCELAFIRDVEDPEGEFVKIPYATDTIVAVLPSAHHLAGQKSIPLHKLADENFLLEVPNTMPHILSLKACHASGFEPKVAITDVDREYLIGLVSKGMGVSLMLKQLLSHFSSPEVSIVEISPTVTTEISLCYLKDAKLSDAAKHFVRSAVAL